MPTAGNIADISVAATLRDDIAPPRRVLADKAQDADHLRKPLETIGTEVVIPIDGSRRRNVTARMFRPMKDWRRIAAR